MKTFHTKMEITGSCLVNSKSQIVVSGWSETKHVVRVMDHSGRHIQFDVPSLCRNERHIYAHSIVEHPTDPSSILESCWDCDTVCRYSIESGNGSVVFKGCAPRAMCHGPDDSVLVWTIKGRVSQLKWNSDDEKLEPIKNYDTNGKLNEKWCSISYIRQCDIVVMLCTCHFIQGMRLSDGYIAWTNETNKDIVKADAVTCDSDGRAYICSRNLLSIIDPLDGEILQQIKLFNAEDITHITCTAFQPQLLILTYWGQIQCYNVERKS